MKSNSRIAELRKKANLSQRDLAESVKVKEATIASWEQGRTGNVWFERLVRLCDALNCQAQDLIEISHDDSPPIVKISELRKRASLSKSELAEKIGATTATISNWENGFSGVEWILQSLRLCLSLKCTIKDLIKPISQNEKKPISDFAILKILVNSNSNPEPPPLPSPVPNSNKQGIGASNFHTNADGIS